VHHWRSVVPFIASAVVALGGCSPRVSPEPSFARPDTVTPSPAPHVTSTPAGSTEAFTVSGSEAAAIATVTRFIEALNAANARSAADLLTNDVLVSDCDFAKGTVVEFDGKSESMGWLAERIADHERLEIGTIFNENARFEPVVGVNFSTRSNDTLARLGVRAGMPFGTSKVVLADDMRQIRTLAFGPGGADPGVVQAVCSPGP
jgi:hypothetical protein